MKSMEIKGKHPENIFLVAEICRYILNYNGIKSPTINGMGLNFSKKSYLFSL